MKIRGPVFFSLVAAIVLVGAFYPHQADISEKESILIHTMICCLKQLHYQPQELNDDFSKKVFKLYLDRIDGGRRWLTQNEVDELKKFELEIDDETEEGSFDFFDASIELLNAGVIRSKGFYTEILAEPFDFKKSESIELDSEKKAFAKNEKELRKYWHKSLKYDALTKLANKLKAQKSTDEVDKAKSYEESAKKKK